MSHLWKRIYRTPGTTINAGFRRMSTLEHDANKKLDGKIAIITGAAGAIGATVSKFFAAHGAQVILADISNETGERKASEIGPNAHYRHCDVSKEEDVASTVDFAVEKFGKLDIMLNNAGLLTPVESLESVNLVDYDRYHAVMVRGVLAGIKHAARVMIPVNQGVILNTASIVANFASEDFPLVYNICKSNLPGLTKIAAYHLGKHGIRVNAVSPHAIFNPLAVDWFRRKGVITTIDEFEQSFIKHSTLLGKRTTEEDIAKAALYLCSDESGYVSGENLVIDGGWRHGKPLNIVADLLAK